MELNFKKITTSFNKENIQHKDKLSRNYIHLFAMVSVLTFALGEFIFFCWWIRSFHHPEVLDGYSEIIAGSIFAGIGFIASMFFGVLQLFSEQNVDRKYSAIMTLSLFWAIFPAFVSMTMFIRSGLSKKQEHEGIYQWNVEHIEDIHQALITNKMMKPELEEKVRVVNELNKEDLLDLYNASSYLYDLYIKEFGFENIPRLYTSQQIIEDMTDYHKLRKQVKKSKTPKGTKKAA